MKIVISIGTKYQLRRLNKIKNTFVTIKRQLRKHLIKIYKLKCFSYDFFYTLNLYEYLYNHICDKIDLLNNNVNKKGD